jgi:D-3-phosphoglycerate dehydrogenase
VQGFDMNIIANDIVEYKEFVQTHRIEMVSKDEIMQRADIVTIHTPLDDSTRDMIDEQRLRMMKPTGILINTARGGIVDESALYKALTQDWIAGAGLDAHATEPPRFRPLVELDNMVSTCHIAGVSDGASYRMAMQTVEKIITYFNGQMPANALTTAATLAGKSL